MVKHKRPRGVRPGAEMPGSLLTKNPRGAYSERDTSRETAMNYVDSHAHFDLCAEEGADAASLVHDMAKSGVHRAVQVAIEPSGFAWARDFARDNRSSGVLFTLGIHPSSRADNNDLIHLSDFVRSVIDSPDADILFGIGETGLDFYRMRQPRDDQLRSFEYQAGLAGSLGLPLIVHSRDAMDETIDALAARALPSGVMHCFSGDSHAARRVLDLGFYISFAGNLTYKNAVDLHDAARYVPLDRVLLETDAPFLTPVPHRGKRNSPALVTHTYEFFADLRGEPLAGLVERVSRNFEALARRG
jgi:TatD DNase family protein